MHIRFADQKLAKVANNDRKMDKAMGAKRADRFRRRLAQLQAAETLEDVRHLTGKYHELTQNRKGQWACDLDHPYRLVFMPEEDPIPIDTHGFYLWREIRGVVILEIVDYHP